MRHVFEGPDVRAYPIPSGATEEAIAGELRVLAEPLAWHAWRLAKLLNDLSETGQRHDLFLHGSVAAEQLGLSREDTRSAAAELEELGYANADDHIGGFRVDPTDELFWEFDPIWKGWTPRADAHAVASRLLKSKERSLDVAKTALELGFSARRMNPAVSYLVAQGAANGEKMFVPDGFAMPWLIATPTTSRFVTRGLG